MQVLLYDDNEMHVFNVFGFTPKEIDFSQIEPTKIGDAIDGKAVFQRQIYDAEIYVGEVKAELDPTTMKRIAKYNLDKEFEAINNQTAKALEYLASLNRLIEEKEEKLEFARELIRKIWEDEEFEEGKYLPEEED